MQNQKSTKKYLVPSSMEASLSQISASLAMNLAR
jgi:hypothetical protein